MREPTDKELAKSIPKEVLGFRLGEGKTPIHEHPQGQEIAELLAVLNETGSDLRLDWGAQAIIIKQEFGLTIRPETVSRFVQQFVFPAIVVPDGYHRAAILAASKEVSGAVEVKKALDKAVDMLGKAEGRVGQFERTKRGGLVRTGPTEKEFIDSAATVAGIAERWESILSKYGMAPAEKPKGPSVGLDLNINVNEAGRGLWRGMPPVDATFKEKGEP